MKRIIKTGLLILPLLLLWACQPSKPPIQRFGADPGDIDYDLPTNIPPSYEGTVFMEHTNLAPNQTLFYAIKVEPWTNDLSKFLIQQWITNCIPGSNYTTQFANDVEDGWIDYWPFTATNTVQYLEHHTDRDINDGRRSYRVRSK